MSSKHEGDNVAFVWTDQMSGAILVRTPYKEGFVRDLKDKIPKSGRRWKPNERVWEIEPQFTDAVVRILRTYYTDVREHEKVYDATEGPLAGGDPYGELLRLAQPDTLKKVYRMIAHELHPDHDGGDSVKMATANKLWGEICKLTPGL